MINNQIQANLHKMGVKGIFISVEKGRLFLKLHFLISFFVTVIIVYLTNLHRFSFDLLNLLSESVTDFFPDILGFTLSGYAIVIGIGNIGVLKKLSRAKELGKLSLYQMLNGMFALGLLIQISTLIYANCLQFVINFTEKNSNYTISFPIVLLFLLVLMALWALLILITIILMLFNIGQFQNWEVQSQNSEG